MKSMKISEALGKERKSLGLTQGHLILQLRGISITQFFKKYFPSNDNIDYSQISQELNQAFYDNDVKKAKELKPMSLS